MDELLQAEDAVSGYGKKRVLNGISVAVRAGEVVAIIGHNGAGKSTLLKAIAGLLPLWDGRILASGRSLTAASPRDRLRQGIVYVPQGHRVFPELTVRENLEIGGAVLKGRELQPALARVLGMFPDLAAHLGERAHTLSGGEKQMLALSRALMLSPRLLLLDEPSLGLSPSLASRSLARIKHISDKDGAGILLVEQNVREALNIADRVYVLRNGVVSFSGSACELQNDRKLREVYL